jgi:pimeloyl-ACP methyl ester carboxylesterase
MGSPGTKPAILLIRGLGETPAIWNGWATRYKNAGHEVLAPTWPAIDADVQGTRNIPTLLIGLPLETIIDHYVRVIRHHQNPPILMGHSFGGLIVQHLADRGLGAASVVIDARSTRSPAGAFSKAGSKVAALRVPTGARILWSGALSLLKSRVEHSVGERGPLLFVTDGEARLVTPAVNRAEVRKYAGAMAITAYLEFAQRDRNTLSHAGWEQVADFALSWALGNARDGMTFDDVKAALSPSRVLTESREHEARM